MVKYKPFDGFEIKAQAQGWVSHLRNYKQYPVQYARIYKNSGRLKYVVYIGGKNSGKW